MQRWSQRIDRAPPQQQRNDAHCWDIYAHHSRLDTNTNEDESGEQLADEIHAADYTIHNEKEATRLPTNCRSTLPDISLASNDIALISDWLVSISLASDYLPIIITINSELSTIDGPRRTYIHLKSGLEHVILKPLTNTVLKLAKHEQSNKPRTSGKQ